MSKKRKGTKTTTPEHSPGVNPDRPFPPPDPDADLETWRETMLNNCLPDALTEAERRHAVMHIAATHHLASELRAVRRAIECRK